MSNSIHNVETISKSLARPKADFIKDLVIWFTLVLLTLLSFRLGHGFAQLTADHITLLIIVVAFIKARLIIRYFMEVKQAPLLLKVITDVWCVVVAGVLIVILN